MIEVVHIHTDELTLSLIYGWTDYGFAVVTAQQDQALPDSNGKDYDVTPPAWVTLGSVPFPF